MHKSKVFIITGSSGEGKTTLLKQIIDSLTYQGLNLSGLYAEGKWEKDSRVSHCLVEIGGINRIELCTTIEKEGWIKENRFYFNPEAISLGNKIIRTATKENSDLIIIDEIGPFEINGKIWATEFEKLLNSTHKTILITAKQKLVKPLVSKFVITDFVEIPSNTNFKEAIKIIGLMTPTN